MSDWALGKKLNSQIADVPLDELITKCSDKTNEKVAYIGGIMPCGIPLRTQSRSLEGTTANGFSEGVEKTTTLLVVTGSGWVTSASIVAQARHVYMTVRVCMYVWVDGELLYTLTAATGSNSTTQNTATTSISIGYNSYAIANPTTPFVLTTTTDSSQPTVTTNRTIDAPIRFNSSLKVYVTESVTNISYGLYTTMTETVSYKLQE